MTDKVRKLSVLLQALSRIPGLGFLADTERDLRESADQVDDIGDQIEDGKRQVRDVRTATGDVLAREDED
jgi:hypothetical protein